MVRGPYFPLFSSPPVALVFRDEPSLFAQLVCCYAIELTVSLDWNRLRSVAVDRMVGAFAEEIEAIGLEVAYEITPFYRHGLTPLPSAQEGRCPVESLCRDPDRLRASRQERRAARLCILQGQPLL